MMRVSMLSTAPVYLPAHGGKPYPAPRRFRAGSGQAKRLGVPLSPSLIRCDAEPAAPVDAIRANPEIYSGYFAGAAGRVRLGGAASPGAKPPTARLSGAASSEQLAGLAGL